MTPCPYCVPQLPETYEQIFAWALSIRRRYR